MAALRLGGCAATASSLAETATGEADERLRTCQAQFMTSSSGYPQWPGFEHPPGGLLLRQVVDLGGPMGIAYERSVGFHKDFHVHSRHMLVCPRGACRMEVRTRDPRETFPIDSRSILLVPRDVLHDDEGQSAVYDTLALFPSEELVEQMRVESRLSQADMEHFHTRTILIRRSPWLNDILERLFIIRVLGHESAEGAASLLEIQILHEVAQLVFRTSRQTNPLTGGDADDDLVPRALRFIEGNLFEALDVAQLCAAVRSSESSLLRGFRRELGQTPLAYVRNRRLDEAANLLGSGEYSVTDVALLVGYENVSAFTKAFRRRFDTAPRDFRDSGLPVPQLGNSDV